MENSIIFNLRAGGAICGLAVVLGAFGAHALENSIEQWYEPRTANEKMASWETGVRYQLVHGLALIAIGLLPIRKPSKPLAVSSVLFISGVVIFSGGLYCWVLLDQRLFVMLVPLGGFCFIAGWLAFVVGVGSLREKKLSG